MLRVPTGSPLPAYSGLSLEQGAPHGPVHIYILRDLTPAGVLDEDPAHREAVMRFSALGQSPATARETVCARSPTPDEASVLRIGNTMAVLAITRMATDATGRVVEAALPTFPGEGIDTAFTTSDRCRCHLH
ncbi:UTRA domain-containing protein [Streptomyces sp. NPDC059814]|uniref:UTRA domain-containing protein n=1 Tax=Streptomyces sp. NPDC059814 TaxID=3346959 RepID=UPI00366431C0